MSSLELSTNLEAILFASSEPLSIKQLAEISEAGEDSVVSSLAELDARLTHGVRLAQAGSTYRLVTTPESAAIVGQFLNDTSRSDLTRPALETLAIIAYRGPITKSGIEQIRGVASEAMLRSLLGRGLIETAGRSLEPGKPVNYIISHEFLSHFGLTSTTDLPPLKEDINEGQ
jgi:segregation and condensation protein B